MFDEQDVSNAMSRASKALEKIYTNLNADDESRSDAAKKLSKDLAGFSSSLKSSGLKLKEFENDIGDAGKTVVEAFTGAAKQFGVIGGLIGAAAVSAFASAASDMTGAFRSMSDIGQTFGGSMLKMSIAAADAGLPLDEFAKAMSKNSSVIATMGTKGFFDLAKNVRQSAEQFGMFGLTTDQMNDYLGEYMDTLRMQGVIQSQRDKVNGDGFVKFAKNMTEMAGLFGKSRDAIMKQTMEAAKNVMLTSRLSQASGANQQKLSENVTSAIAMFASIPGAAGEALSNLLAETAGSGTALFAETAKPFIESGLGNFVDMFEKYARQAADGMDVDEFAHANNEMIDEIDANVEQLRLQAMAGDGNAKQVLAMRAQMHRLDQKDIDDRKRQLEEEQKSRGLLNVFAAMDSVMKRLFGQFKLAFLKPFEQFADEGGMQRLTDHFTEATKTLGPKLEQLGTAFGKIVYDALSTENLNRMSDAVLLMIDTARGAASGLMDLVGYLTSESGKRAISGFFSTISSIVSGLAQIGKFFYSIGESIGGDVGGAIAVVLGGVLMKKIGGAVFDGIGSIFKNFMGLDATIRATNATITVQNGTTRTSPSSAPGGGSGGGAGDVGDLGSGDNNARNRNRRDRLRKWGRRAGIGALALGGIGLTMWGGSAMAAEPGEEMLGDHPPEQPKLGSDDHSWLTDTLGTAATVGGIGATVAKMLGKKIPGLGAAVGATEAAALAASGDNVGAALAGASGAASTFAGPGTIASLLIDGVSLARDQIGHEMFDAVAVPLAKAVTPLGAINTAVDGLSSAWDWLTKPSTGAKAGADMASFAENVKANHERDETRSQEMTQRLDALKDSIDQMTAVTARLQSEGNRIAKQNVTINQQIAETAGALA